MKYKRGFTLIELLVAMAILSILLGITVPRLVDTIAAMQVRSTAQLLHSRMRMVQDLSMSEGVRWKVDFMYGNQQVRFYHPSDYVNDVKAYRITLPAAVSLRLGGPSYLEFTRDGTTNTRSATNEHQLGGHICLETPAKSFKQYVIWSYTGRIRIADIFP